MSTYSPGTVAVATVRGVPNVRVMRTDDNGTPFAWCAADPCDDAVWATAAEVTDVRPLVALDPSNPDDAEQLGAAILLVSGRHVAQEVLEEALKALVVPTKPAEPTGLGAVVEDAEGVRWVKVNGRRNAYRQENGERPGRYLQYADIAAVKVLSAGWSK